MGSGSSVEVNASGTMKWEKVWGLLQLINKDSQSYCPIGHQSTEWQKLALFDASKKAQVITQWIAYYDNDKRRSFVLRFDAKNVGSDSFLVYEQELGLTELTVSELDLETSSISLQLEGNPLGIDWSIENATYTIFYQMKRKDIVGNMKPAYLEKLNLSVEELQRVANAIIGNQMDERPNVIPKHVEEVNEFYLNFPGRNLYTAAALKSANNL